MTGNTNSSSTSVSEIVNGVDSLLDSQTLNIVEGNTPLDRYISNVVVGRLITLDDKVEQLGIDVKNSASVYDIVNCGVLPNNSYDTEESDLLRYSTTGRGKITIIAMSDTDINHRLNISIDGTDVTDFGLANQNFITIQRGIPLTFTFETSLDIVAYANDESTTWKYIIQKCNTKQ